MTAAQRFAKIPMDIGFTKKSRRGGFVIAYGAISYYRVLGLPFPADKLKHLRPDVVRYVEITGEDQVSPHRDHTTTTSLNCYFESGGCVTHFWNETSNSVAQRFPGAATSNIYKDTDLEHVSSFTALDGDAYLLDVSTIHSVERFSNSTRRFIQLSWRGPKFDDVLKRLTEM